VALGLVASLRDVAHVGSSVPLGSRSVEGLVQGGWEMEKVRIEQHSFTGTLWVAGWLFSIGYLRLSFWKGVLAIALWPYYLGATFGLAR